jgi:hypothetical protein
MNKIIGFLSLVSLIFLSPAKAETAKLNSPSWKEVPGTELSLKSSRGNSYNSAYIDINNIKRKKDILEYDAVVSDAAGYERIEANCKTNEFRTIWKGTFESKDKVNYEVVPSPNPWSTAISSYQKSLIDFVCGLK